MMSKKEKIFLKWVIANYKIGNKIDTRDIYGKTSLTNGEIDSICDSLYQKGLINKESYKTFINGGKVFPFSQQIADHWSEHKFEILRFIVSSVVIPIIVGSISSVLTSVILGLIGLSN